MGAFFYAPAAQKRSLANYLWKGTKMASKKGNRIIIKLKSTESGHSYTTEKNRKNDSSRLELKKYDPLVRRHVVYRETK
jgi:large subunit ribosomal protein L33